MTRPGEAESAHREIRLARQFMDLVLDEQPALVATIHESTKRFHPDVPPSFGQTIVYGVKPVPPLAVQVVEQLNQELEHPYEVWATHYYPVETSSTERIVEAVGCIGLCIETWMGFAEERRIVMQRRVVELLLAGIGIVI